MTTISEKISSPKRIKLSSDSESVTFSTREVAEVAETLSGMLGGGEISERLSRASLQILLGLTEGEELTEVLAEGRISLEYPPTPSPRLGGLDARTAEMLWKI